MPGHVAWKIGAETAARLAGWLDRAREALDEDRPGHALDGAETVLRSIDQLPRGVLTRHDRAPLRASSYAIATLAACLLDRDHPRYTIDRCIQEYDRLTVGPVPLDPSALRDYARLIRRCDRVDGAPLLGRAVGGGAQVDPETILETARWLRGRQAYQVAEDLLHRSLAGTRPVNTGLVELLVDVQAGRGERDAAVETAIRAGQELGAAGHPAAALAIFRRAMDLVGDNAAAVYGAATALTVLGRWSEAFPLVGRLLADGHATLEVAVLAGQVYSALGRIDDALDVIERGLDGAPDDAGLRAMRVRILFAANRYDDCMAEVDRLLADTPEDADLLRLRADTLAEVGRWSAAAEAYRAVLDRGIESSDVVLRLAAALREAGRVDESLAAYDRASRIDPSVAYPHAARAQLLFELDRVEAALAAAEAALALDDTDVIALEVKADALAGAGRPTDAIPVYRSLLRATPGHLAAWRGLAEALRADGRTAEALQVAVDGLAVAPEDEDLVAHRAVLLADAGEWDEALPLLERVVDGDNSYSAAFLRGYLAECLRRQERFDEALRQIDSALTEQPDDAWMVGTRGQILRALGDPAHLAELRRATERDGSLGWVQAELGDALRVAGDAAGAIVALDRALEIDPSDSETWASKGAAEMALERYDEAERSLDQSIALGGDFGFAYGVRAQLRAYVCRDADALADVDRAVGFDPAFGYAWVTRGFLLYARDDAAAEESFRRGLALDDSDHIARVGLAETLLRRGDEQAATPLLREVVELIQTSPRAIDAEALVALGWAHLWLREFDLAARRLGELTFIEPGRAGGYFDLGIALLCDGRGALAAAEFARGALRVRAIGHAGRRAFLLREARWDLTRVLGWLGRAEDSDDVAVARWLLAPDGPAEPDWRMEMALTPEAYPCPEHSDIDLVELVRVSVAGDPTQVASFGYSRRRRRTPAEHPFVVIVRCPGRSDDAHDVECAGSVRP